jgi:hypothetical protein
MGFAASCASRGAPPSAPEEAPATSEPAGAPAMEPSYAQPPPKDKSLDGAGQSVSSGEKKNEQNAPYADAADAAAAVERDKLALDQALSGAQGLATDTACRNACSALGSMRRSVDALCGLAGDGDNRCQDARTVLEGSERRVSDAGCHC